MNQSVYRLFRVRIFPVNQIAVLVSCRAFPLFGIVRLLLEENVSIRGIRIAVGIMHTLHHLSGVLLGSRVFEQVDLLFLAHGSCRLTENRVILCLSLAFLLLLVGNLLSLVKNALLHLLLLRLFATFVSGNVSLPSVGILVRIGLTQK